MKKIESTTYTKEQIKLARAKYETYLTANCKKGKIIEMLSGIYVDYFPDMLCAAHLKGGE